MPTNNKLIKPLDSVLDWASFKRGDLKSFESLYRIFSGALYNYGSKFSTDKDLVKDCIQDLFVNIWARRESLGNPKNVKNYLFKAFRLSLFKKLNYFKSQVTYEEIEEYSFEAILNREDQIIKNEGNERLQEQLQLILNELTAKQREIVFLKFYENLSYDEIAEIMEVSVKATYKMMARAMEAMREKLENVDFYLLIMIVGKII